MVNIATGNKFHGISLCDNIGLIKGEVLTTPIQLANFAAIIANKGWYIHAKNSNKKIDKRKLNKEKKDLVLLANHNSTYSTQYLHMNKRGLKVGSKVKQGDKIGEVGMTSNSYTMFIIV